ncbi:MAG: glycosyltransferase [Chloroflexi bacterium]|nr:glycosyltransferase [Chloroflexota bacterium]
MAAEDGPPGHQPPQPGALPVVSVVVPCLNRAAFLRETLESILSQDYPPLEVIVGDGGSTDGTLDILRSYGDRITWFSGPDSGAFDAIIRGWAMARGEILAWLNADDLWAPGVLRRAATYLAEHPETDVVYGACRGIDACGRQVWFGPARPWDLRRAVLECDHIINQPAAFMRRSAVERAGGLRRTWLHDQDLWLRMALTGGRFDALPEWFASGRIHAANMGMAPPFVLPAKVELTRAVLADPRLPASYRSLGRRAISNAYVRGFSYLQPRDPRHWRLGARQLAFALREDPTNLPHALARVASLAAAVLLRRFRR